MSNALKCDRCGELYECDHLAEITTSDGVTRTRMKIVNSHYAIDLCEKCCRSFEEWWSNLVPAVMEDANPKNVRPVIFSDYPNLRDWTKTYLKVYGGDMPPQDLWDRAVNHYKQREELEND